MGPIDHFFLRRRTQTGQTKETIETKKEKKQTPIEDFAIRRIREKTGNIDTKKAYELNYLSWSYETIIHINTTQYKREGSPDLHTKEIKTNVYYIPENDKIKISNDVYRDGKFDGQSGNWREDRTLDNPNKCEILRDNWNTFVKGLDSIAEQIKHDCPEKSMIKTSGCNREILEKIKETENGSN